MIPFNVPTVTGNEIQYVREVLEGNKFSGDGPFNKRCEKWLEDNLGAHKAFLTPSCTASLEMAALLIDIKPGDEVIMPSYTFVSTANAFVLRGATCVFVDIRPDTLNIDENLVEDAITEKTRAIVVVHYAGVSCEMDTILSVARKYNIYVIEDAAQAILSKYKDQYCGTIGDIGCFSFHETKNIQCGEGGAILINREDLVEKAEIIREKGTNRTKFWKGEIDKYTWVNTGSSYLLSEVNAAFLLAQLEQSFEIISERVDRWNHYHKKLQEMSCDSSLQLPQLPKKCTHNGHIFFILNSDHGDRDSLISYMKDRGCMSVFHYIPLHSSPGGKRMGRFNGADSNTTSQSSSIVRLPLYHGVDVTTIDEVVGMVQSFYSDK